ncbi:MAG: LytTR family DNA-binding domain-containing protein [Oscillospiraceae bacterium]
MRIAVCDDEKHFFITLHTMLEDYAALINEAILTTHFLSGMDLLASIQSFDLIFMDYKMDGLDGMATAKQLRLRNQDVTIIFLTGFPHVVFESFAVNTFRFLVKPLKKQELFDAMDAYLHAVSTDDFLLLHTNDGTWKLRFSEILYIEARGKHSLVRTRDKQLESCKYLKEFIPLLPDGAFMRTHKSSIVHFLHIRNHDNNVIYFDNGERAAIGKRYLSAFKTAFQHYIMRYNSKE